MNDVRAWKDPEFRASLSQSDLAGIGENPAGPSMLSNDEMSNVQGGTSLACLTATIATIQLSLNACGGTRGAYSIGCC